MDYSHGVLYVRWTYGDLFTDLSHSRMLHWQVLAEGKKGSRRRFSIDVRFYTCIRDIRREEAALSPKSATHLVSALNTLTDLMVFLNVRINNSETLNGLHCESPDLRWLCAASI